ncbi:TIR domain-containing protein [Fictibacillus phosphorivorans]|uniref:TIR domain-containing protein n=1 Tax=Fictibacillus phosphorivorans TaxID=1221500 RepID=UPI001293E277|nr:TIR domain-containing protein [Fictibacillus phosphorivorans]MQR96705.1 TIR domain-containing protein [Fictibacillus phosphorivorans]
MAKKVFVSYHSATEDTNHKNLLVAWSKNDSSHFDIKFDDLSVGVSINSDNANYIKNVIKGKIKDSAVFLCLVGENTHKSDWVKWEIDKAVELGKKIVAVKIKSMYQPPSNLYGVGAVWAMSFTYDSIKKALDS